MLVCIQLAALDTKAEQERAKADALQIALDASKREVSSVRGSLAESKAGLAMAKEVLDQAQVRQSVVSFVWGAGFVAESNGLYSPLSYTYGVMYQLSGFRKHDFWSVVGNACAIFDAHVHLHNQAAIEVNYCQAFETLRLTLRPVPPLPVPRFSGYLYAGRFVFA